MVRLLNAPILTHETYEWRAFDGHLIAYQREGQSLRSKVSLYNSITYEVILCADLGLYYECKKGHAFDHVDRRVFNITDLPLQVLQPSEVIRFLSFYPLDC